MAKTCTRNGQIIWMTPKISSRGCIFILLLSEALQIEVYRSTKIKMFKSYYNLKYKRNNLPSFLGVCFLYQGIQFTESLLQSSDESPEKVYIYDWTAQVTQELVWCLLFCCLFKLLLLIGGYRKREIEREIERDI